MLALQARNTKAYNVAVAVVMKNRFKKLEQNTYALFTKSI